MLSYKQGSIEEVVFHEYLKNKTRMTSIFWTVKLLTKTNSMLTVPIHYGRNVTMACLKYLNDARQLTGI